MKKCPQCGKEYPDDVTLCALDRNILEPCDPAAQTSTVYEPVPEEELPWQTDPAATVEPGDPEEFVPMATMEPSTANDLLSKFEAHGIQFQIDRVEQQVQNKGGVRSMGYIQVFVRRVDKPNAFKIYTADWKV